MTEFNVDAHSEKVIKDHLTNTVMLWSGTFKNKKFYRVSDFHLSLPKVVSVIEAFYHEGYGWCVAFRDDDYPSVSNIFKPFSVFLQDYSCLKN